jgi:hypothetical protein
MATNYLSCHTFRRINGAYKLLADADRRRVFDRGMDWVWL